MILLQNATLFDPDYIGQRDLLFAGGKVVTVAPRIECQGNFPLQVINLEKKWVFPGIIDGHVHIAGAGGDQGPVTRTPGMQIEDLLQAGITSVVGCLGTDGITRNPDSLLMKTKEFRARGFSAWMTVGSYQCPPPTITGNITRDIILFEEIVGVGELAIADHRSSHPTLTEFIRVCQEAHLGGVLGGKSGVVNLHIGDDPDPFELIHRAVEQGLRYPQFLPTHCNRNPEVFQKTLEYARQGPVDITTCAYPFFPGTEIKPSRAFLTLLERGIPLEHITFSSDAGGTLPDSDTDGNCTRIHYGSPDRLLGEVLDILSETGADPRIAQKAFRVVTANVAGIWGLHRKGRLQPGYDADLAILDPSLKKLDGLFLGGRPVIQQGKLLG